MIMFFSSLSAQTKDQRSFGFCETSGLETLTIQRVLHLATMMKRDLSMSYHEPRFCACHVSQQLGRLCRRMYGLQALGQQSLIIYSNICNLHGTGNMVLCFVSLADKHHEEL